MIYVHYGFSVFIPSLFVPVRNSPWKPKPGDGTGLWACREGELFGWKEWSWNAGLGLYADDDCFRFTLAPGAKVLELSDPSQLDELPKAPLMPELQRFIHLENSWVMLDYERLAAEGVDAIELTDWVALRNHLALWDCNCLFVMNPDVIVEVEKG